MGLAFPLLLLGHWEGGVGAGRRCASGGAPPVPQPPRLGQTAERASEPGRGGGQSGGGRERAIREGPPGEETPAKPARFPVARTLLLDRHTRL